jgi:hypothetical protein
MLPSAPNAIPYGWAPLGNPALNSITEPNGAAYAPAVDSTIATTKPASDTRTRIPHALSKTLFMLHPPLDEPDSGMINPRGEQHDVAWRHTAQDDWPPLKSQRFRPNVS